MNSARNHGSAHRVFALGALVCSGIALAAPHVARACTRPAPVPSLIGIPADGDSAVPTDVVPYYQYPEGFAPGPQVDGNFTLTAADGTVVALTARMADQSNYELVPAQPLEPKTAYMLHAEWLNTNGAGGVTTDDLHFTTGDGPLAAPPAPPTARLFNFSLDPSASSGCGLHGPATCVSVADDDAMIVFTYAADPSHLAYGNRGSFFANDLSGAVPGTSGGCIELRTRAINGMLSDPIQLCADSTQQAIHTPGFQCTWHGLTDGMPSTDAGAQEPQAMDAGAPRAIDPSPALVRAVPFEGPRADMDAMPPVAMAPETPANEMPAASAPPLVIAGKHPKPAPSSGGCSAAANAPGSMLAAPFAALGLWVARRRRGSWPTSPVRPS
jgi:uncharacterized protein (TIGR03382 family)